ncbi:MAG: orotate phosphoribosyltransferase [Candidatus Micrarchaeota archaeon]|nr:orotate phosphoribosyltransferase [Candidatus Micrarchaeota archaeon]
MQKFQEDFIDLAIFAGALKFGSFTLKSGRQSPYYFNSGVFYTGEFSNALASVFAELIARKIHADKFDTVFGPAYKGIPLCVSTSMALAKKGVNKPWCFNRKEAKEHGDKGNFVGAPVSDGSRIIILDDVFTTGGAKEEAMAQLQSVAKVSFPGVFILLDRQEKDSEGKNAIAEFEKKHKTKVYSVITADEIFEHLKGTTHIPEAVLVDYKKYKKQYGV